MMRTIIVSGCFLIPVLAWAAYTTHPYMAPGQTLDYYQDVVLDCGVHVPVPYVPDAGLSVEALRDAMLAAGITSARGDDGVYRSGIRVHPFMAPDQPFDLFEDLNAVLGTRIPQPYIASPTVTDLAQTLVNARIIGQGTLRAPPDPPFVRPAQILRYGDVIFQGR